MIYINRQPLTELMFEPMEYKIDSYEVVREIEGRRLRSNAIYPHEYTIVSRNMWKFLAAQFKSGNFPCD